MRCRISPQNACHMTCLFTSTVSLIMSVTTWCCSFVWPLCCYITFTESSQREEIQVWSPWLHSLNPHREKRSTWNLHGYIHSTNPRIEKRSTWNLHGYIHSTNPHREKRSKCSLYGYIHWILTERRDPRVVSMVTLAGRLNYIRWSQ